MGHIDHGKSTLLDYIRKTNIVADEAGGITQHVGAYEVEYTSRDGQKRKITFLDTPGHEAFCSIRERGATIADIAILVVSAEDGVKPQTLEALNTIKSSNIPYIVAINKIDKPNADIDKTKQSLL
jgi:translation initiation factor IF-2